MNNNCLRSYMDIRNACKEMGKFRISVAVAQDEDVLRAIKMAEELDLAESVLVGDSSQITPIIDLLEIKHAQVIHEPDDQKAALKAVSLIRERQADVLMKGLINSSDFLRAVLNPEVGLKTGNLLSHLAVYEIPGQPKLFFMTDGGMNISPDLLEKKGILINSIAALGKIGIQEPKVAIIAANEKVNHKMLSTVDAQALVEMREKGDIPSGILEGPIALDVAISPQSAEHKGLKSRISGDVDLFLMPNIDAGNVLGKSLIYYANAKMAGLVLGAASPIVLTSRAETAEGKLNSLAMARLLA